MMDHGLSERRAIRFLLEAINIADYVSFFQIAEVQKSTVETFSAAFSVLRSVCTCALSPRCWPGLLSLCSLVDSYVNLERSIDIDAFQVFSASMNVRLSVVYSEQWTDSQRIDLQRDIETTLSQAIAYVTEPIYQISQSCSHLNF